MQTTWSVKVDEELKQKIVEIAKEDFDNNSDFMQSLINLYSLNQVKESGSVLSTEVEQIQKLTNRIVDLFVFSNSKVCTTLENKQMSFDSEMVSKEDTIKMLHEKLKEVELERNKIGEMNDTLAESNKEYAEEAIELNKSRATIESLVNEYKDKNDMLTGMLQEYKEDREEKKLLKAENDTLKSDLHHLQLEDSSKNKMIDTLNEKLVEMTEKYKAQLDELVVKHYEDVANVKTNASNEIKQIKKGLEVEHNLSSLKMQQEYQDKISVIKDKYSGDIEKLQEKHSVAIESYQDKYKELLGKVQEQQEMINRLEKQETKHIKQIDELMKEE